MNESLNQGRDALFSWDEKGWFGDEALCGAPHHPPVPHQRDPCSALLCTSVQRSPRSYMPISYKDTFSQERTHLLLLGNLTKRLLKRMIGSSFNNWHLARNCSFYSVTIRVFRQRYIQNNWLQRLALNKRVAITLFPVFLFKRNTFYI
jgi:hypothetical protein